MMPTYEKLAAYMSAHGLVQGDVSWEHYVTDPGNSATQEILTHVYIMLEGTAAESPVATE
jgi:effector-binding domain-containing protein